MIKGLTFPLFGKKIKNMAQTTTIPITTVTVLLLIAIMLTGTTTNVVSVWAGTFPGPNGQIAFVSLRDGNDEIYVMNADGSGQTRLTDDPANNLSPSWSPNGERIAFSSNGDITEENDPNYDIYVMNADDGSGQTRLTNNNANDLASDWGTNTSPPEGDGNGSSSTTPSQQASDDAISANTDNNTSNNTNYNNHDVLLFLTDEIDCFTNNDSNDLNGNNNNDDEQFSEDVEVCLNDVIGQYFNNDNNLDNNNDSQDNNNISSDDNNNIEPSSQET